MDLGNQHGDAWRGCHIHENTLTTDNGESYTLAELRYLRWERNQYAALARSLQRELERAGTAGAIWFSDADWKLLRQAVAVLDAALPGEKRRPETGRRAA